MSRTRYAGQFLNLCREARQRYQEIHRPKINQIRSDFVRENRSDVPRSFDESLEAHIREYFINHLLVALNWVSDCSSTGGLPNLIPESPVASIAEGTTRFLDYFGIEQETLAPLLIVETKRPDSPPPKRKGSRARTDFRTGKERISSVISAGLNGEELTGEWPEWLGTLKDYVQSIHARRNQVPKRVVLTSGRWMIIFIDPADSFLPIGSRDAGRILAYELADEEWNESGDFVENYNEIYGWLEHQRVLGACESLEVPELASHIKASQIVAAMHGLQILYYSEPVFWGAAKPQIKVAPVVFLRSNTGVWIMVERKNSDELIPHSYENLTEHLETIRERAEKLLMDVGERLGAQLFPSVIENHYLTSDDFEQLPGVRIKPRNVSGAEEYLIVTGQYTHYLKPKPSVTVCPYIHWGNSNQIGMAEPEDSPIARRRVEPRSFFQTGEQHHCTHHEVALVKAQPITSQNRDDCGIRSGKNNDAFCEIIRFEKHLCCRTCVYEDVCAKAKVFKLPCSTPLTQESVEITDLA